MLVREVECASVLTDKRTCQILGPDDGHFTFHFATASCLQVPVLYAARAVSISTDVVVTHHFPIGIAHSKHQCHCCCNTDNACYSSVHDRLNSTCALSRITVLEKKVLTNHKWQSFYINALIPRAGGIKLSLVSLPSLHPIFIVKV